MSHDFVSPVLTGELRAQVQLEQSVPGGSTASGVCSRHYEKKENRESITNLEGDK